MFEKLLKKADEYLTNKIKSVVAENETTDKLEHASLPDIQREKLLACSIQKTHMDFKPVAQTGYAMDSAAMDSCNRFNENTKDIYSIRQPLNDIIYTHFATQGFIGFQACAILTQNWLINKACLLPTKDAIRPNYTVDFKGSDEVLDEDKDKIKDMQAISDDKQKFDIKEVARVFAEKKRQFGQSLAYPLIEGVNYEEPFNIDAIKLGSYKGMTVIDPVWYNVELDSEAIMNPESLRFFKPTYFKLPNGTRVHYTWVQFGVNGEVPDILKSTYRFGGYPIPQLIYERAYSAEKVANEAPMLAQSKRLLVADINVAAYLTNTAETVEKLKAISQFRDNWGVMTKRPGDSVQQIDTSLTDLDEVIMTQYQLTAAAAGITATKLLETQPKGFNSTGDYEDDQYKLTLTSIQKDDFAPLLEMHYRCLAMSKYGLDREFTVHFEEIDTPTEKERAEINEINSRTYATYVNAGVITGDEVRERLKEDEDSGFNTLSDEIPEDNEPFDFGEEQEGNGETLQNPFSEDEFNLDEWKEEEHPRNEEGEFTAGNSANTSTENLNKNENFKQEVESVIEKAKNNPNERASVDVGDVSSKLTKDAKEQGYNISGYKHNVDVCGVRHAFNKHGKPTEYKRGQIPLDDDDIKTIPEILYNYDEVIFGEKTRQGVDLIKYKKQMPDNTTFYVEEIRTGKKTLTTKTMYKISR